MRRVNFGYTSRMGNSLIKLMTIVTSALCLVAGAVGFSRFWNLYEEVQAAAIPIEERLAPATPDSNHAGSQTASGAHGEAAPAHGGAPAAHGETTASAGHGEAPPSSGGHGAASAGHGAGGAEREPASASISPLISIEEVVASINETEKDKAHILGIKLEIELFDEANRQLFDQHQAGIRNTVLITSMEQSYENLNTIGGKLFYKELLVSRLNQFFQKPFVRDIHFSSFYMQ